MKRICPGTVSALALIGLIVPAAHAQTAPLRYADPGADDGASAATNGGSGDAASAPSPLAPAGDAGNKPHRRTKIVPYLEVDQSVYDQVQPQSQVLTYTTLAAGADVTIGTHRTTGSASIRYEHHFSETRGTASSDTVTGLLRTTTELVPRALTFDFGGLATNTAIGPQGGTLLDPAYTTGSIYRIWSLYGGPSLSTHAGILAVKASYDLGYSEVDQLHSIVNTTTGVPADLFGHSLTQQGTASIGVRPGEILPFGLALNGAHIQEDMSSLDQRLVDDRIGIQAIQPVSRDLALVGDVGWEKLTVSQRNALLDANGNPVLTAGGQYITDSASPRQIAYRTDGLTWDVGVMWRPSRRTQASAFVGRRYDSTTYYGALGYAPNSRETLTVSVFDGIYGFGSGLTTALQQVPTDIAPTANPFNGNFGNCLYGGAAGACLGGALGSANALVYHVHGFNATSSVTVGRLTFNLGGGYFARRYLTAPGTVLASYDGVLDQTWYASGGVSGRIDQRTQFYLNSFVSLYHTDQVAAADLGDWGVNGTLSHHLTDHLVGTASFEVLGVNQQVAPDQVEMLGQLGLRYNFR